MVEEPSHIKQLPLNHVCKIGFKLLSLLRGDIAYGCVGTNHLSLSPWLDPVMKRYKWGMGGWGGGVTMV
jgi:hypothetical protein